MKQVFTYALIFFATLVYGQKAEVAVEKDAVVQEAQSQLAVLASQSGELTEYCTKNNISGEFVMDLTIQGKGKLLTIYMVSSNVDEIKCQNMLKNKLMEIQFSNIKLPKNERVKFRHTLTF